MIPFSRTRVPIEPGSQQDKSDHGATGHLNSDLTARNSGRNFCFQAWDTRLALRSLRQVLSAAVRGFRDVENVVRILQWFSGEIDQCRNLSFRSLNGVMPGSLQ
jgi:hypothetical protein